MFSFKYIYISMDIYTPRIQRSDVVVTNSPGPGDPDQAASQNITATSLHPISLLNMRSLQIPTKRLLDIIPQTLDDPQPFRPPFPEQNTIPHS